MKKVKILIGTSGAGKTTHVKHKEKSKNIMLITDKINYNEFYNETNCLDDSEVIVFDAVDNIKNHLNFIGKQKLEEKDIYFLFTNLCDSNLKELNDIEELLTINEIIVFSFSRLNVPYELFNKYSYLRDEIRRFESMVSLDESQKRIGYYEKLHLNK